MIPDTPVHKRKVFWAVVFLVACLFTIFALLLGEDAAFFFALHPLGWLLLLALIFSPFFFLDAWGQEKGKNWAWVRLIPGSIVIFFAGRSLAMEISSGSADVVGFVFMVTLYVIIPFIISIFLIWGSLREGRLTKKFSTLIFLTVFIAGFLFEWNSEWATITREASCREYKVDCPQGTRFFSLEDARKAESSDVCLLSLSGSYSVVPEDVALFTSLKSLGLTRTNVTELPAFFSNMKKLEVVELGRNFSHIPQVLCEFPNLQKVYMLGSDISQEEILRLWVSFPDVLITAIGVADCQPKYRIEEWQQAGIRGFCDNHVLN